MTLKIVIIKVKKVSITDENSNLNSILKLINCDISNAG